MRFLSVCSGIEAASVAWLPLGWECAGVAEIAPFPSAVLAHHYPGVRNHGDFTKIDGLDGRVDLLVGGTPCQSFSVAGLRGGLTPIEVERLFGLPDDYTLVPYRGKPASDGPRYQALGNSMAVPVVAWIGKRIELVEALPA